MKQLFTLLLILGTFAAQAATEPRQSPKTPDLLKAHRLAETPLFHANEWQLDLNGFSHTGDLDRFRQGLGLGVNYFPWRAAGFGLEAQTENAAHSLVDRMGVSLIGRLPVDKLRISPEFKLGWQFDFERPGNRHDVFAGIGGELRITSNVGLGAELRGVKPTSGASEYLLGIARLRYSF